MTNESKNELSHVPLTLDAMREAVARRVDDEQEALQKDQKSAPPKPERPVITHDFVVECARARDKGNGILYATIMRGKFLYVAEQDQWLEWQGHYWEPVHISRVNASVERVAERYAEASSLEKRLANEARNQDDKPAATYHEGRAKVLMSSIWALHSPAGVSACIKFANDNDDPLIVKADALDPDLYLIGCVNGVVDLRTGEHRPGRTTDLVTRVCLAEWHGLEATPPKFASMVHEILGERPEVTEFFHRLIGYAMCGKITEKLFVILLGEEGDSGKTTLFEILYEIVKGYASPMPVEMLLDRGIPKDPDNPSPSIMGMKGNRLMWASEPGENRRFSVDRVKLMSGNDSLMGRYPYGRDIVAFTPTHTLFLLTNHKMRAGAHDQPFWSRVRLLNCPFSFVADPVLPNQRQRKETLKEEIIATEGPGILAWIVRGFMAYQLHGLKAPDEVRADTDKYRREEDLIAEFVEACLEDDPGRRITGADMYTCFKSWFQQNYGKNAPSIHTFGRLVTRKVHKEKIGGTVCYLNVDFNDDARKHHVPLA